MDEDMVVLAGDIGGTKTNLALFSLARGRAKVLGEGSFLNSKYASALKVIEAFLKEEGERAISAAAFGVAGPVQGDKCSALNIDWTIDAAEISESAGIEKVRVVNDLVATGVGIGALTESDFFVLQAGEGGAPGNGNAVVLAAGTGLGEAILFFDGTELVPSASEGGHADFAPQGEEQIELLKALAAKYGHVSYERLLSGEGLENIFHIVSQNFKLKPASVESPSLSAAEITELAIDKKDPTAVKTLSLFASIYGAEAGNAALRAMALGGVYIGGGIAPKIIDALKHGDFIKAFLSKGRYEEMMKRFPIRIILNERAPLLGAALLAFKNVGVERSISFGEIR